tara:strand:+ start:236 stop:952 length:717 start_codon:yes stop_codon:yes gene_type:complete
MNIKDLLLKYRLPLFAPESEGAPAAAPAAAPVVAAPVVPAAADPAAPVEGDPPAAPAGPNAGDPPASEDTPEGTSEGDEPDASAFKMDAPEGMENFQGEFDTFSSDATDWIKSNPDATPADALKWAAGRQAEAVGTQAQTQRETQETRVQGWEATMRADKEFGGDNLDANMAIAKRGLEAFGDPELMTLLEESSLGSHPAMMKYAIKAGKSVSDTPVIKTNDGSARKTLAESLYGKKD